MNKLRISPLLLALFVLVVSALPGCNKAPENDGAAYAAAQGWYAPLMDYLDITTREQVDRLAPTVDFPALSAEKEKVTFSLLQTAADDGNLYVLTRVYIHPSVAIRTEYYGVGTPAPSLSYGVHPAEEAPSAPEVVYPVYTEYADGPGWEIYTVLCFPREVFSPGASLTLECIRLYPLMYNWGEGNDPWFDLSYVPLPDLNLQLTWTPRLEP